jgi:serpin B
MTTKLRQQVGSGWALGLGLLSFACGSGEDAGSEETKAVVEELRSQEARVVPDAAEAATASQGEQELAVSMLHALDADENLAFSPHSISTAFAMVTDAAAGQTLEEIESVLHFSGDGDAFHRAQGALDLALEARNRPAIDEENRQVEAQILSVANDLWLRADAPPQASYLDTLARYYGAGVYHAQFGTQPEQVRLAINEQVASDTHDLITGLIPEKVITRETVAVLTNALYFKAPWVAGLAKPGPSDFHGLNGTISSVDMLRTQAGLAYYAGEGFAAVSLPYYGGELEMMLIVPEAGGYESVRAALSSDMLTQIVAERGNVLVNLTLPKFNIESVVPAKKVLEQLGMETPFIPRVAEFPKFESELFQDIYISDVLHQSTVAIDERGTEASAATAVVINGEISLETEPAQPVVVNIDRPFLFAIRDNPTGAVLFVGQIVAP